MQKKAIALIIASTLFAVLIVFVYIGAYNIFKGNQIAAILGTILMVLGILGALFGKH